MFAKALFFNILSISRMALVAMGDRAMREPQAP
jgi:hypothetical protein